MATSHAFRDFAKTHQISIELGNSFPASLPFTFSFGCIRPDENMESSPGKLDDGMFHVGLIDFCVGNLFPKMDVIDLFAHLRL